ncbi:MAG: tetratricopeptide repeat protein [Desulfobacteraceae bacterium]|nr:tetratricopeptide repeat protein [Desulfobacteraceae bacterium]
MKFVNEEHSYGSSHYDSDYLNQNSNEDNYIFNSGSGQSNGKSNGRCQLLTEANLKKHDKKIHLHHNFKLSEKRFQDDDLNSSKAPIKSLSMINYNEHQFYNDQKKIYRYQSAAQHNEKAADFWKQENQKLGTYIAEALNAIYSYDKTDLDKLKRDVALNVVGLSAGVVLLGMSGFGVPGIIILAGSAAYKSTDRGYSAVKLKFRLNETSRHMGCVRDLLLDEELIMLDPNAPEHQEIYQQCRQMCIDPDEERLEAEILQKDAKKVCKDKTVDKLFGNSLNNIFKAETEAEQKYIEEEYSEQECKQDVYWDNSNQANALQKARQRHIESKANRFIESKKFVLSHGSIIEINKTLRKRREEIKKKLNKSVKDNMHPFKGSHYRNMGVDASTILYHTLAMTFEFSSPETATIKIGNSAVQMACNKNWKNSAQINKSQLEDVEMENSSDNYNKIPSIWSHSPSTVATALYCADCLERYKPLIRRMAKFNATPKDLANTFYVTEPVILSFCRENNICAVNKYMFNEWTTQNQKIPLISKDQSAGIWAFLHQKELMKTTFFKNGKMTNKFWKKLNSKNGGRNGQDLANNLETQLGLSQRQSIAVVNLLRTFPKPMTGEEIKDVKKVCDELQKRRTWMRKDAALNLIKDIKEYMDLKNLQKLPLKKLEFTLKRLNTDKDHAKMHEIIVQLSGKYSKDKNGNRPFHIATMTGNEMMIREFMTIRMGKFDKYLWSESIKNNEGQSPLDIALNIALDKDEQTSIKTFIELERKYRPNGYKEKSGQTAEHIASGNDSTQIIVAKVAKAYYERGAGKRTKKDYDEAIIYLNKSIEVNPNDPEPYKQRGLAKIAQDSLDDAIIDFSKAIELDPNDPETYKNRGIAKRFKGDFDDAIIDFNKAIELNPNDPETYNNLGLVKNTKGDYDEAIINFNKAINLNSKLDFVYHNRGLAKRANRDYDEAIIDFNKAIEINPELSIAYYHRGFTWHAKGRLDDAIKDYNMAIEINPKLSIVYHNLGLAKHAKGYYDEAIINFNKAADLKPKLLCVYYNRGNTQFAKKNYDEAIDDYTNAIRLNPKYAKAYYKRGNAKHAKRDYDGAIKDFKKGNEINASKYNMLQTSSKSY